MIYNIIFKMNTVFVQYLVLLLIYTSATQEEELCGSLNGKTAYLQRGERINISHNFEAAARVENHTNCGVELVTCPSCVIRISFGYFNFSNDCDTSTSNNLDVCCCKFLSIWEPVGPTWSTKRFCKDSQQDFISLSRSVRISLQLHNNQTESFVLFFAAQRNQDLLAGAIGDSGQFKSPYFPMNYPQDIELEHFFSCKTVNCKVMVKFNDFLLSAASVLEVFDWDGQRIHIFSGVTFRPPIIQSSGQSLLIKFYGNSGTSFGYSGLYNFVNSSFNINISNTECGGEVTDFGGVIIMGNLHGYYDCYWILRPLNVLPTIKTHIYLKIIAFSIQGVVQIKSGIISKSEILESININEPSRQDFKEHIIAMNIGFYISMMGLLDLKSKIVIAYAVFNYMDCNVGADLKCGNKRCIPLQLSCDGFDNCGDNSDESVNCDVGTVPKEYQRYYFPKSEVYPDMRAATQVFIISCIVLLVVVFALMIALCQVGIRARNRHELTSHIRTISQLLSVNQIEDRDDPPVYEPPPEYSQVVKPSRTHRKHSKHRTFAKGSFSYQNCVHSESVNKAGWKCNAPDCNHSIMADRTALPTETLEVSNIKHFSVHASELNVQNLDLPLCLSPHRATPNIQHINVQKYDIKWISSGIAVFKTTEVDAASFDSLHLGQRSTKKSTRLIRSQSHDNILQFTTEHQQAKANHNLKGDLVSSSAVSGPLHMQTDPKKLFYHPVASNSFKNGAQRHFSDDNMIILQSKLHPGETSDFFFREV